MELNTKTGGAFLGAARPREGEKVKVKIIHDCIVLGKYKHVGNVIEVEDKMATTLVGLGRAVYIKKDKPQAQPQEKPQTR